MYIIILCKTYHGCRLDVPGTSKDGSNASPPSLIEEEQNKVDYKERIPVGDGYIHDQQI